MCFADFAGGGIVADSTTDIIAMSEETIEDVGSEKAGGTGEENKLGFAHRGVGGNGVLCFINNCTYDDNVEGVLNRIPTIIVQGSKYNISVGSRLVSSVRGGCPILVEIMITTSKLP